MLRSAIRLRSAAAAAASGAAAPASGRSGPAAAALLHLRTPPGFRAVSAAPALRFGGSLPRRALSSSSSSRDPKKPEGGGGGPAEGDSSEIVLTPGEKVVAGTRLTMWAGIACFAAACAYYVGKELLPTKMSPNTIYDKATDLVREDPAVRSRFGERVKTYGREHGGHREGRRNFIEHSEYTDKEGGDKRVRVRFNLEGDHGSKAFVFAEVSSDMPRGEFVYSESVSVEPGERGACMRGADASCLCVCVFCLVSPSHTLIAAQFASLPVFPLHQNHTALVQSSFRTSKVEGSIPSPTTAPKLRPLAWQEGTRRAWRPCPTSSVAGRSRPHGTFFLPVDR